MFHCFGQPEMRFTRRNTECNETARTTGLAAHLSSLLAPEMCALFSRCAAANHQCCAKNSAAQN